MNTVNHIETIISHLNREVIISTYIHYGWIPDMYEGNIQLYRERKM